ncbi:MAG TPA: hypothetical protein VLM42_14215 [Bryobacteraceae bacterium]|nr:hypothetical protein [Bryobacteraceae bacterium]
MTIGFQFKEIYIRLNENDSTFVCTVRYGGMIRKSTHFPLEIGRDVPPDLEQESMPAVRIRNRRGESAQGED